MVLAKKTSKNQITLPKKIVDQLPDVEYFDVQIQDGAIQLYPVDLAGAVQVREKLEKLGIDEKDVREAVKWARSRRR
ncbi:MAG TPA: AbrB/MazE/SpoVT family DNA-binding domain-containing protein [Vicinamibacteria bacterium]|nr:AbrB/MazE/SpoVT family DNA-binding domain-containing protein [Vicinamibacteria bacterium]